MSGPYDDFVTTARGTHVATRTGWNWSTRSVDGHALMRVYYPSTLDSRARVLTILDLVAHVFPGPVVVARVVPMGPDADEYTLVPATNINVMATATIDEGEEPWRLLDRWLCEART